MSITTATSSTAMKNLPKTIAIPSDNTTDFLKDNLGLVNNSANRFIAKFSLSNDPSREDIFKEAVQEGFRGLHRALSKFDPSRGKFSTYAMPWIDKYVRETVADICKRRNIASLDAPIGDGEDAPTLGAIYPDERSGTAFNAVADQDEWDYVHGLLRKLPPREQRIIELHFGLDGDRRRTLREIASELGVSTQRVKFILDRTLVRLRKEAA